MGAAFFYHLTESPLEAALPLLLTKARERPNDGCYRARVDGEYVVSSNSAEAPIDLVSQKGLGFVFERKSSTLLVLQFTFLFLIAVIPSQINHFLRS